MVWSEVPKALLLCVCLLWQPRTACAGDDVDPSTDAFLDSGELLNGTDPASPRIVPCYAKPLSPDAMEHVRALSLEASTVGTWAMQDSPEAITIPVNFHDMGNSTEDDLTESIKGQFEILRRTYANYGFNFELHDITQYNAPAWSKCSVLGDFRPDHPTCIEVTRALRRGTFQTLNVFVLRQLLAKGQGFPLNGVVLGEASMPLDVLSRRMTPDEALAADGVRIRDITLGDRDERYHGKTLIHEVGHWLGLLHPFDIFQRCRDTDQISDTPPTNHRSGGCPVGLRSCGQLDPIHNHMMYTNDTCRTEFTKGQM